MAKLRFNKHLTRLRLLFHSLGLSCLGGAVFLQVVVFKDIAIQGYFLGIETNPVIIQLEIGLAVFALIYLVYLYVSTLRSIP